MLHKNIFVLFALVILLLNACKRNTKFDRDNWNEGDGLTFSYREIMVDDLLQNYKLKGMKYQQVIHLLHRPQQSDKAQMTYEIADVHKLGKPRYVKSLVLSMKDSVVTDARIYEHTDKK